jgi:hypothetical protein
MSCPLAISWMFDVSRIFFVVHRPSFSARSESLVAASKALVFAAVSPRPFTGVAHESLFGPCFSQSRRDSVGWPRVAAQRLPWENSQTS